MTLADVPLTYAPTSIIKIACIVLHCQDETGYNYSINIKHDRDVFFKLRTPTLLGNNFNYIIKLQWSNYVLEWLMYKHAGIHSWHLSLGSFKSTSGSLIRILGPMQCHCQLLNIIHFSFCSSIYYPAFCIKLLILWHWYL